jgi:hypothetical protein
VASTNGSSKITSRLSPASRNLLNSRRPSLVAFCADEKEVVVAFLSLGYDVKRPELVTLFGGLSCTELGASSH